ncbi:hypothetical protein TCA2_4557 [Paenibacillus sp. TCA20]|uniref:Discoidin domain-containing protein n=1 Tax=Paenibacillus urinalis TaxID=521520 RepID=A0ABY7XJR8_9BACL|nr:MULTISPECIES: discoidin domain-containing protein [Paenibacillus]WDI05110.1 discoidin domain-containing protein [Paenibacillus urinalis]GAK42065.1 hypothetical protein TCA2_4557 [Paenibacillus sp. TCA20]
MAAPATTGLLRTKVAEMEIGDYIKCGLQVNPSRIFNHLGKIDELNDGAGINKEMPLTGLTYSSNGVDAHIGYFYFIKVSKGLLIADRICLTGQTGSWNDLNKTKHIEGVPWNSGNNIPVMTSNTVPSGLASASSEWVGQPAFKAFDGNISNAGNAWVTNSTIGGWLQYDFPEPRVITGYAVCPQISNLLRSPKDWTFEAWDETESRWVILDQRIGIIGWASNAFMNFSFANKKVYSKYRINVSANSGDATYLSIQEMQLFEVSGVIRTLTGGVAFADSEGNKALTEQNPPQGAWPTNNEWDRYITKYPESRIQEGKTLNDIFHFAECMTWTQDTGSDGISSGSAARRVIRGGSNGVAFYNTYSSDNANIQVGFRPVLEYKEV